MRRISKQSIAENELVALNIIKIQKAELFDTIRDNIMKDDRYTFTYRVSVTPLDETNTSFRVESFIDIDLVDSNEFEYFSFNVPNEAARKLDEKKSFWKRLAAGLSYIFGRDKGHLELLSRRVKKQRQDFFNGEDNE